MSDQTVPYSKLRVFSWALYDLAAKFFTLNVLTLYFVRWITMEKKVPELFYSAAFGASMVLVAFLSPLAGAFADRARAKKKFFVGATVFAAGFFFLLALTKNVIAALILFALTNFSLQFAVVFYNTLIVSVAPREKYGIVSGFGKTLGYVGSLIAVALITPIAAEQGKHAAILPSAAGFALCVIPSLFGVREPGKKEERAAAPPKPARAVRSMLQSFAGYWRENPDIRHFFLAAFWVLCPLNTLILFMSVYMDQVLGLTEPQIFRLVLSSTVFAMAGSMVSGWLSDRMGYKRMLMTVLFLWLAVFFAAALVAAEWMYWVIGAGVGLAMGATWTVSRALAARLVPQERLGEMFGLFAFIGYAAAVAGPVFFSILLLVCAPLGVVRYRIGLLSLTVFLFLAARSLRKINV
ncbi:MAG: MFS transporter [Candidatus Omnitrophica bacterium]|nr:MFS transporter [Candidatus Omnitrophota bacterium]